MTTFLGALNEALRLPLGTLACLWGRGPNAIAIGFPPNVGMSYTIPQDCFVLPAPEIAPVVGGQCPVRYRVLVDVRFPDGSFFPADIPFDVTGPVLGVGTLWRRTFFGDDVPLATLRAPNDPEAQLNNGLRQFGPFGVTDNARRTRTFIRSITRLDGQPDNCGNTPADPPPNPPPQTFPLPNITFDFGGQTFNIGAPSVTFFAPVFMPNFGGLHIPVNIRLAPSLAFPGGISLPVYISLPDFVVNTRISFFNIDLSGEIRPPGNTPEFPQIPVPPSGSELPTTRRLIGVNVTCTLQNGARPSVITDPGSSEDLYVPYLAVVRFSPPTGFSVRLGTDVQVKTLQQYVPCPYFYGAEDFDVLPNGGVSVVATPVFADVADLVVPV